MFARVRQGAAGLCVLRICSCENETYDVKGKLGLAKVLSPVTERTPSPVMSKTKSKVAPSSSLNTEEAVAIKEGAVGQWKKWQEGRAYFLRGNVTKEKLTRGAEVRLAVLYPLVFKCRFSIRINVATCFSTS